MQLPRELKLHFFPGRLLCLALSCLVGACLGGCAGLAAERQPAAVFGERRVASPLVESATQCRRHLSAHADQTGRGLRSTFAIASWNAQKSTGEPWQSELRRLARKADLLLLQEAALVSAAREVLPYPFVAVAEGYYSATGPTGVLSASDADPLGSCTFVAKEPLFRTRKASSITVYPLTDRSETLMVANVHSINFSLGIGAYRDQLQRLAEVIEDHQGPVIFAGDFNVWNSRRRRLVTDLMRSLGLREVAFRPDLRKRVFDHPLDRIYWRGLGLKDAGTLSLSSSDHNPLLATFSTRPQFDKQTKPVVSDSGFPAPGGISPRLPFHPDGSRPGRETLLH